MARVPGVREDAQRVEGHVCGQDRGREAADALGGRGYYEHGADRRGYRNGNRLGKVKTVEGEIEFAVPQLADMAQPFRSKIREVLRGRTEELERLLVDPVLVITDGAPGMIRAAEEVFPRSLRQGCLAHKIRNLQSKVPEEV